MIDTTLAATSEKLWPSPRSTRGGPDYLPVLRSELLHVIRKYVNVDVEAIQVNFERDGGHEVLELSVALPERPVVPASVPEPA